MFINCLFSKISVINYLFNTELLIDYLCLLAKWTNIPADTDNLIICHSQHHLPSQKDLTRGLRVAAPSLLKTEISSVCSHTHTQIFLIVLCMFLLCNYNAL